MALMAEISTSVTSASVIDSPDLGSPSILAKEKLQDLVNRVDPSLELMEKDLEDVLIDYTESFVETLMEGVSAIAKHRKSKKLEQKDVLSYLKRGSNFSCFSGLTDDLRGHFKRTPVATAHKQRISLIKKCVKKY